MARVLVIDDDAGVRESMIRMLRSAGYTVLAAASGEEGFELAQGDDFDVVLSDMRLPGLSGLDVLRKLREVGADACFIIMTGFGTVDTAVEAMKFGAFDYVQKPFELEEMEVKVEKALELKRLRNELDYLRNERQENYDFDKIVGQIKTIAEGK